MNVKFKGRQKTKTSAIVSGVLLAFSSIGFAAEMDHSQHQGMDHSKMDHGQAAQAAQHVHHAHGEGQWMFEFRAMRMEMEGLLDGSDGVSTFEISGANMPAVMGGMPTNNMNTPYMMAPRKMTMDMKMLMLMYGFSDKLSGMLMFNHLDNEMDMVMHMYNTAGTMYMMDMTSSMDTSGVGDTQIGGMYKIDNNMTAGLMLSVPTGDIDEKVMMMGASRQAPYAMQLGTGTYDLIPSIVYTTTSGMWTYGGKGEYRYHIGENDNDYTWGDKLTLSGWAKNKVNNMWSVTGRVDYMDQDEIDGEDPLLSTMMARMMSPTNRSENYGGTRIDLTLDVTAATGPHNFGAAFTRPIKYDLNGPQMKLQSIVTLSYMYMM